MLQINDLKKKSEKLYQPLLDHEDWHIINYGSGIEPDENIDVSSAIKPFTFIDKISKGTTYFNFFDTSSGTTVTIPGTHWFANDESSSILIYQKKSNPIYDLASIPPSNEILNKSLSKDKYEQAYNKVGQLINLKENWDSYGGSIIDKNCAIRTIEILDYILIIKSRYNDEVPAPFIAPVPSGGIQYQMNQVSN